jgi:LysM repeat protein
MTRETKIGLLVGMGVILFIGILISDYLSSAQNQRPADLTQVERSRDVAPPAIVERSTPLPPPRNGGQGVELLGTDRQPERSRVGDNGSVGPIYRVDTPRENFRVDQLVQQTPRIGTQEQVEQPATPRDRVHHVQPGETLFDIAKRYYGNGEYYTTIYEANRDKMRSPNTVNVGVRLVIPNRAGTVTQGEPAPVGGEPAVASTSRYTTYTVKPGDAMSILAQRFYGTSRALPKLIELNRDKIDDPDWVPVGTVLKVPASPQVAAAQ